MIYLVHHFLEESDNRLPDKVALICGDQRLTYKEINDKADRLATALRDMGITRQDRVLIFMDNSAESVISLFGILKVDAIFVMPNAAMKAKKLNYILKDSGARALITHTNKARIVQDASNGENELEHMIWCTPKGRSLPASPAPAVVQSKTELWRGKQREARTSQPATSNQQLTTYGKI